MQAKKEEEEEEQQQQQQILNYYLLSTVSHDEVTPSLLLQYRPAARVARQESCDKPAGGKKTDSNCTNHWEDIFFWQRSVMGFCFF